MEELEQKALEFLKNDNTLQLEVAKEAVKKFYEIIMKVEDVKNMKYWLLKMVDKCVII